MNYRLNKNHFILRKKGLPSGAFRRIGSTDQRCTDDDMHVFYQDTDSYDQTPGKRNIYCRCG